MPIEKQLDLWPEPIDDDREKRPDKEIPEINSAAEAPADEKYVPNVEGMLARMRAKTNPEDPEKATQKQKEYFRKVYNDSSQTAAEEQATQAEIARVRESLKQSAEEARQKDDRAANQPEARNLSNSSSRERDDPWSDLNPPIMWERMKGKRKF
jgi:C4-type Zn-finger protein